MNGVDIKVIIKQRERRMVDEYIYTRKNKLWEQSQWMQKHDDTQHKQWDSFPLRKQLLC